MWSGGISNPISVVEQLTYLLFIKRLDELHTLKECKATRLNVAIEDPIFDAQQDHLRWSRFKDAAPGSPMTRRYAKFIPAAQQSIANKAQEAMSSLLKHHADQDAKTG
jgi:hypothetical protein